MKGLEGACGTDQLRPSLCYVRLEGKGNVGMAWVATNGWSLVNIRTDNLTGKTTTDTLMHPGVVRWLANRPKSDIWKVGSLRVSEDGQIAELVWGDEKMMWKGIGETYPDHAAIMPTDFVAKLILNLDDVRQLVRSYRKKPHAVVFIKLNKGGVGWFRVSPECRDEDGDPNIVIQENIRVVSWKPDASSDLDFPFFLAIAVDVLGKASSFLSSEKDRGVEMLIQKADAVWQSENGEEAKVYGTYTAGAVRIEGEDGVGIAMPVSPGSKAGDAVNKK